VTFLAVLFIASVGAPIWSPYDPLGVNMSMALLPPSRLHWFGTDEFGRDILTRILYGGRLAFVVAAAGTMIAGPIGVCLGLLAGFYNNAWTRVIDRFFDVLFAFPTILLALLTIAASGPGLRNDIFTIGLVFVPHYGRISKAMSLRERELEYVTAALHLGIPKRRVLAVHILPSISAQLLVIASTTAAAMVLAESVLSFLGVGIQPPAPSWGLMINQGQAFLFSQPYVALLPGAILTMFALALQFTGDGVSAALNIQPLA